MLHANDLHKTYGEKESIYEALRGVSLAIKDNESVAIVGKSGSGKSTLIHLLASLDTPTSGDIYLDNEKYSKLSESRRASLRSEKFGFVFQQFFLQANLTVLENVILPLKISRLPKKERLYKAHKILKEIGLESKEKKPAKTLSGGEKQRVAIARALINDPEIIFADEPTGNLDSENTKKILDLMFSSHKKRANILVIVTHDMDIANRCDRTIMIKDGRITK